MKCKTYYLTLKTDKPIYSSANSLRGFIGRQFQHLTLLHNHSADGSLIYTFPRVQYRIMNGYPVIIGIEEGIESVKLMAHSIVHLLLNDASFQVKKRIEIEKENDFGIVNNDNNYTFINSWLALNKGNYKKYKLCKTMSEKKKLLEKVILPANIISMSKSLGYTVPAPIEAKIINLKEVQTSLKGTPMLGFLGNFSVNFEIPDYWGIGKSVSRGFGTVKRV